MDSLHQNRIDPGTTADTLWLSFRNSPIHGTGAFARVDIRQHSVVIEYVGEIISKQESLKRCEADNEYIFGLDEQRDVDGNVSWNPARLINHSCDPNCEAQLRSGQILIVAIRDIPAGDEITFNYGYDLEDYTNYPCRCGSSACVGYMVAEDFFAHVRSRHTQDP